MGSMKEKSKRQKPKRNKPIAKPSVDKEVTDTSSEMDFGGIPKRDLKKNLGCS
jgi:hypothetical protein